ncbi:cytochrome c [Geomicrobium sp. JCM 19038]|uniref:c-type cytochrome n=1 Tax=Geomicrobium sp. JCM 19038 TaxID=1460635 RepID=UPI00045F171D|nr:cytochrome c [Geomicrobium sp. JCM 19038]GAK06451.1 cytochrome c551 [Geomicrobium sp. JCM 19038]
MKGQPLIPFAIIAGVGILLIITFSFIGLGAGGDDAEDGDSGSGDPVEMADSLFEDNCLSCHGDNGAGGSAPAIAGMDAEAVLQAIEEGPGMMPADLVTGEEAEAVAEYVANQ